MIVTCGMRKHRPVLGVIFAVLIVPVLCGRVGGFQTPARSSVNSNCVAGGREGTKDHVVFRRSLQALARTVARPRCARPERQVTDLYREGLNIAQRVGGYLVAGDGLCCIVERSNGATCSGLHLRGGGRVSVSLQRLRRREAKEQIALPIGKSMWRRQHQARTKGAQAVRESLVGNLAADVATMSTLTEDAAEKLSSNAFLFDLEKTRGTSQSVADLQKLEDDARALLQRVKEQKGLALKQQRRVTKSRKRNMRAKGRVDDPSNWRSMM